MRTTALAEAAHTNDVVSNGCFAVDIVSNCGGQGTNCL
jgi:hypothetical protein